MNNTDTLTTNNQNSTQVQKGYKKTAIGIIPSDWEVKKLSQIGELKNGINKDKDQFGFGFPLINLNDVFEINTDHDKEFSLVNSNEKERKDYSLNKGDVLFVRSSVKATGVGLTCVILNDIKDAVYSGFIIRFRDNHFLDLKYKVHCFYEQGFRNRLLAKSTISANININQVALNSLQLPIPPLPEQQKIGEILSTWDDAISICKTTINSLKDRNKGLALQLLTGKKRICKSNVKWEETTIEKITKYFSNKNKELIDARIYSVTNSNGFVYQSDHFSREVAGDDLTGYKIIRKNEFAYNPARINVGSIAFFTDDIGIISSLYVCFKTNEKVSNEFFIEWLKIEKTKHDIERYGEGGVRIYLWYDLFKKLKINLPSIEEQNAIVEVLATANQELKSYQDKLEALQLQKKGLMQQLLTGKIRVNVK